MQISQIFISDQKQTDLPSYIKMATETVKKNVPHSVHKIYQNEELLEWIKCNYGSEMLRAYEKLVPYAYKADLARYLLLYKIGGWYFDITIRVVNSFNNEQVSDEIDFITFFDSYLALYNNVPFACANGIIYSKKNSIILENVINQVYKNIKDEFYGKNSLFITGGVVLGKSVATFGSALKIVSGSFIDLTPGFTDKNRGFVFNNGFLFALHKHGSKGGDLVNLGIRGTNNYKDLWRDKKVFRQDIVLIEHSVSCIENHANVSRKLP